MQAEQMKLQLELDRQKAEQERVDYMKAEAAVDEVSQDSLVLSQVHNTETIGPLGSLENDEAI